MRKASILFVENKLEECQSDENMLQLNEIARKIIFDIKAREIAHFVNEKHTTYLRRFKIFYRICM